MVSLRRIVFMFLLTLRHVVCWPEGIYGLPMPSTGCPHSMNFNFNWEHGSRSQQTKPGSYSSNDNHLAGISASKSSPSDKITQNFCIKTSPYAASEYKWEKGSYCIYKAGDCPPQMLSGSVYWDDDVPLISWEDSEQSKTGSLPEGEYGRDTRIDFCCRADGSTTKPIKLPTEYEFFLLRLSNQCQKVEGMDVKEEWVQWAGNQGFDRDTGTHPLTSRTPAYLRMYYCYYTKQPVNPTLKIVLITGLSIVCCVILSVLSAVIIFIVRRCVAWKCDKDTPVSHDTTEPMVEGNTVIYRPGHVMATAPPIDESRPLSLPPTYEESLKHNVV